MDPRLVDLFNRWRAIFVDAGVIEDPARCFAAHADHLLVIDVEGRLNRYAHYGAAFAAQFGADLGGRIIDVLPAEILPADRRGMMEFEYNFTRRVQRPLWRSYTAVFGSGVEETWQRLVLPAGGERLVVGAYPVADFADNGTDTADGLLRLVIERVPVVVGLDGGVTDLALSLKAFTETQRHAAELEVLATRDALTGIANLRHFRHLATLEMDHARLMGRSVSMLALDIDHFKRVNDSWGHAAGDIALQAFVGACKVALREYDILGRCGGEEFAVALPNTGPEGAHTIAERLRRQVEQLAVVLPSGASFALTVSVGVATVSFGDPVVGGAGAEVEALLAQADAALYRSKAQGRNTVTVHQNE